MIRNDIKYGDIILSNICIERDLNCYLEVDQKKTSYKKATFSGTPWQVEIG